MENEKQKKFYGEKKFQFIGKLKSTKNIVKSVEGKPYLRLNLPIFDGKSTVYVEAFSFGIQDFVYATIDKKWTSIPWMERNDPNTLKKMYARNKYRAFDKEFSNSYDLIMTVKRMIEDGSLVEGTKLKVDGNIEVQVYKDEPRLHYQVKSICFADENDKVGLNFMLEILLDKESVKLVDGECKLEPYVLEYLKLDGEDNKNPRLIKQALKFEPTSEMGKKYFLSKVKIDKGYRAFCTVGEVVRTAPDVVVEPLTEDQLFFISEGWITQEEAERANTTIVSDNVEEYLVVTGFSPRGNYKTFCFDVTEDQSKEWLVGLEPKKTVFEQVGEDSSDVNADLMSMFSDNIFGDEQFPF